MHNLYIDIHIDIQIITKHVCNLVCAAILRDCVRTHICIYDV